MFCPTCGKEVSEGSNFCLSCGTAIFNNNVAAQTAQEQGYYTSPQQNIYQTQPQQSTYMTSDQQGAYQSPYQQAPGQPQYQMGGHYQPPYGQPSYSYNSDAGLFHNPHTGLLTFIVILGFLTAIFCNCGLIKFNPEMISFYDQDLYAFRFFPMWLIATALVYLTTNGEADQLIYEYRYSDINMEAIYNGIMVFFIVMAVLALFSFIFSCIIAGKSSLRHRHPSKQLKAMNTFLILNWIFWLIYTVIILLPMILVYKEVDKVYFMIQYTVPGYLYTGCLVLMTILKGIYSKKVMNAYTAYERGRNSYYT